MEFLPVLQNNFDELKPSLFELLSEHQLAALLPPSLRYLLALATHRHPRYLIRILNSFDEVYALLSLLVERHFLLTYGGGFTENFYGLKRERVLRVKGGEVPRAQLGAANDVREALKLGRGDVWRNLAIMVGVPYLKRKLDEGYDVHAAHASVLRFQRREELRPGASVKERLLFYYKWFLRRVYPSVNAAYYFSLLAFNLAYLFDGSKFHSPWLWLVGTRMRRMGRADYKAIEAAAAPKVATARAGARPGQGGSVFNPRVMAGVVYPRLLSSLRILLPTSIFALKFLEWWHASDFARQLSRKAAEALELPPPVVSGLPAPSKSKATATKDSAGSKIDSEKTTKSSSLPPNPPISSLTNLPILTVPYPVPSDSSPPDTSLCPICTSPIVTPTAAPSGYVYCYTCIHKWVDGAHERQTAFMEGGGGEEGWDDEGSREGRWESGKDRDAVTGRRVLGGTSGLRRVII
ncbi:ubiquitin-protein ligase peroxin 12 [Coniosporium apollinis]|uniref:Peroxisome assembly protein 12 n=1 Tax=Coniosporium apollinis TaxID=61459 RepID=A0ABQ9P538_9PEZI|nr:ubiquitin-protein ligase peroxin 12 [Coniosporium apollinis]